MQVQLQDNVKLTPKQAAGMLGVTISALYRWRKQKIGPRYYRHIRRIFYFKSDVLNWELGNRGD